MKKKIVCLIISTLMIVTVFPVVGLSLQTVETKDPNQMQPTYRAPTPGYAPNPPADVFLYQSVARDQSEKCS